jgi:hypothetical protein
MSHTNLRTINSTEINNSGAFRVGDNLSSGTTGQVLKSNGDFIAPSWETDTDTTYQGGTGISINTGTTPHTINASNIPNSALQNSTISGISLGGNLATLTFYDSTGAFITSYNGATPPTSITLDGDTTYQGSTTINIDTATTPDTINVIKVPNDLTISQNGTIIDTFNGSVAKTIDLEGKYIAGDGIDISNHPIPHIEADTDEITITHNLAGAEKLSVLKVPNTLSAGNNLSYSSGTTYDGSVSRTIYCNLIGNTYPSNPTDCYYLDLSSTTNIIPGAVFATKIQRTTKLSTFSNVYSEYSSDFRTSFIAQSANVMVEFRAIVRADNRVFYGGLYDYNAGVYNTDTRNRFNYNDETDQDHSVLTWWMRNLTPGTTYYISPYFRGQSASVYIYAGHSGLTDGYAPAIMRIIDGGNNVDIY